MGIVNKVTQFRSVSITTLEEIQNHLDEINEDGWELVGVDNIGGWYRFFWKKTV